MAGQLPGAQLDAGGYLQRLPGVPVVEREEGEVRAVLRPDLVAHRVHKERVHLLLLQQVQGVLLGPQDQRLPTHLPLQQHQGHLHLPGNPSLRQEAAGHPREERGDTEPGVVQARVSYCALSQHQPQGQEGQLLQLRGHHLQVRERDLPELVQEDPAHPLTHLPRH